MDENFTKDIEQEENDNTTSNSAINNAESPKDEKTNTFGGFLVILIIGFIIWFLFFRVPTKVTTKMIENDQIVETITKKEIMRQLEDTNLVSMLEYKYGDIEQVLVDVSIPTIVKANPDKYQIGDRYKVSDGYAFPVEFPLKLHLTIQTSKEEDKTSPIDINVSGVLVHRSDGHNAFREVEIEYEDSFMTAINLSDMFASFE